MGIIALDTDLDSAIHILNYHLSSFSSPTVQSIFKYRIALLTKKITKTQKKVANIVSPFPISNSFASLTVEDAEDECTVDNVSTPPVYNIPRKSREGPKKGSAGDSKKAVLNSLLTPLDVSKGHKGTGTAVRKALSTLPEKQSNEQSSCWRAVTSANTPRSLAGYYSRFH